MKDDAVTVGTREGRTAPHAKAATKPVITITVEDAGMNHEAWVSPERARKLAAELLAAAGPVKAAQPIVIAPDAPALLAQRLVRRLASEHLLPIWTNHHQEKATIACVTEALADEIHQSAIDGTLRA